MSMDTRLCLVAESSAQTRFLVSELQRRGANSTDLAVRDILWHLSGQIPTDQIKGAQFSDLIDGLDEIATHGLDRVRELAVGAFHEARLDGMIRG